MRAGGMRGVVIGVCVEGGPLTLPVIGLFMRSYRPKAYSLVNIIST
jgi:hypothetical protein